MVSEHIRYTQRIYNPSDGLVIINDTESAISMDFDETASVLL